MKTHESSALTHKGRIITLEGTDAVGKRTQSLLLQNWFRGRGFKVKSFSFPDYRTPIGKEIEAFLAGRRDYGAEVRHMLFAANRWEKASMIRKSQTENEIVIVNRYTESNLVYGVANGLRLDWLIALEEGIPKSDWVLVLDAPVSDLVSRRYGPKDYYEKNHDLQVRVQTLYKELGKRFGWVTIDGSGGVRSVHGSIIEVVKSKLDARPRARL